MATSIASLSRISDNPSQWQVKTEGGVNFFFEYKYGVLSRYYGWSNSRLVVYNEHEEIIWVSMDNMDSYLTDDELRDLISG